MDLSKCNCDKAGFCPVFDRDMDERNHNWCKTTTTKKRQNYCFEVTGAYYFGEKIPEKNSELAICTIPADQYSMELLEITRDSIKEYAKKCGADYIELSGDKNPDWSISNKYRVYGVASRYKKTLYLDCDIIVSEFAPDIFLQTPDDKISAYDEWEIWESQNKTDWITSEQSQIIDELAVHSKTKNSMINGGVLVIPNSLCDFYKEPTKKYPKLWCFDQNYLTLTLPQEKFNKLDSKWNCLYTFKDGFWYNAPRSYFLHVNSLGKSESRKAILSQVSLGDFCPIEPERYEKYPTISSVKWKQTELETKTNTFKKNEIGLIQGEIAPGGALTWMKFFSHCFKDRITGIVPFVDFLEYRNIDTGMTAGYSQEEMEELYIKSDTIIYWAYYLPKDIPLFIKENPLNKKIIYLSHSGFRHNKLHDLMIKVFNPDVSVFVDEFVAKHYNGIYIPPPVFFDEKTKRKPIPKNILWHHRLETYKGIEVLSDIIQYLPDFNFHIAGNWVEKFVDNDIIKNLVNDKILSPRIDNVFYYGKLNDMSDLFKTCSLSLSTSYDESFGLSVAESIANGIPTVSHSTGIGYLSDFTVNYKSHASEWAKTIRICEEMSKEAKNKNYVRENFSIKKFKEQWDAIL